ncbi:phage major tail protein, TP901-1 family [Helcococcus bovis]|uniref:phage major tail protein, TP901-1 family n=1 Tax=Helcococcus bovis TaxID=3153252 RepID=UPI0038BA8785
MAAQKAMEPIKGKDKILFVRLLSEAKTKTASKILYQVDHTIKYSNSTDVKKTKDGNIQQSGGVEITVEMNALLTDDELNKMMRKAVIDGDIIELWEVNLKSLDQSKNQADALYMQAKLNDWEDPASVEEYSTFKTTAAVIGMPKEGKVTLSKEQQEEIQYAFKDLTQEDGLGV